jgi:predicted nucleic acid-binding protein
LRLDGVRAGTRVLVDSTIFVYHFTGASLECRRFLERCERGEIKGLTSTLVLAEVAHRLMTLEALSRGLVTSPSVARKLREHPELVQQLHVYHEQLERIPLMGIDVVALGLPAVLRSGEYRRRSGLTVNDSLLLAAAQEAGVDAVATADADFRKAEGFTLFLPEDLA